VGRHTALLAAALALGASTEGAQDRADGFAKDRNELVGNWIYNDLSAGYTEAKKSGKPLLVVFR